MTAAPSPTPSPQILRREDDGGVVTLTLTQPQNRNALGLQMIDALIVALADLARDEGARVIVLAGDGPALSAGHNLKEMQAHRNDADRGRSYYELLFARCSVLMQAIVALPEAGHRGGRRHRHRGRLPTRRRLRSRGRERRVAVRAVRHQRRPLLLDAARGRGTRRVAQACAGDGDDRQAVQRRGRRALRPRQPGRSAGPGARRGAGARPDPSPSTRPPRSPSASAPSTNRSGSRSTWPTRSPPRPWSTISPSRTASKAWPPFSKSAGRTMELPVVAG